MSCFFLAQAFRTPLDQLPSHEELQKQLQDAKVMKKLLRLVCKSVDGHENACIIVRVCVCVSSNISMCADQVRF